MPEEHIACTDTSKTYLLLYTIETNHYHFVTKRFIIIVLIKLKFAALLESMFQLG